MGFPLTGVNPIVALVEEAGGVGCDALSSLAAKLCASYDDFAMSTREFTNSVGGGEVLITGCCD
jgi:hypothetical protein